MPASSPSSELKPSVSAKVQRKAERRSGDPRKRDARKRDAKKRLGKTLPRIYTKPLAHGEPGPCGCGCALTPETSLGFSAAKFAADVLLVKLLPWQRWLLIHALELLANGRLRFRNIVVLVARQNGKSTLSQVLALWSMSVMGRKVVLGTAQDLDTAEEVWQGAVDLVEEVDDDDQPVRPDLYGLKKRVIQVNGKKALELWTGERYKIKAANRKAGRGLSGDLIFLDELREHQNWFAWAAITKTTMARPHAQVWCLSNAGDITSVVLAHLRKMAHRALGDPDGICSAGESAPTAFDVAEAGVSGVAPEDLVADEAGLFLGEWSARPGCDKWDRDEWAQANPSMNHPMGPDAGLTEQTIASACATDPDGEFRTEVLCQWPDGTLTGPFFPGTWESTTNRPALTPAGDAYVAESDRIIGDVCAAIDVAADRSRAYVAFAGYRADAVRQVEVVAARTGVDWVAEWLMHPRRRGRIEAVTGQGSGAPVSDLLKAMASGIPDAQGRKTFTIPVVALAGADMVGAYGQAYDAVRDGEVRHNPQPLLDHAAAIGQKRFLGDNWVLDRKNSPGDVAPLIAWINALWLLSRPPVFTPPPPPPPKALSSQQDAATTTPPRERAAADLNLATVGF